MQETRTFTIISWLWKIMRWVCDLFLIIILCKNKNLKCFWLSWIKFKDPWAHVGVCDYISSAINIVILVLTMCNFTILTIFQKPNKTPTVCSLHLPTWWWSELNGLLQMWYWLNNSSINNKLILRNLCFRCHISCFCSILPTQNSYNTVLRLWATWRWFVPEWFNRLNDSVQSQWLIC